MSNTQTKKFLSIGYLLIVIGAIAALAVSVLDVVLALLLGGSALTILTILVYVNYAIIALTLAGFILAAIYLGFEMKNNVLLIVSFATMCGAALFTLLSLFAGGAAITVLGSLCEIAAVVLFMLAKKVDTSSLIKVCVLIGLSFVLPFIATAIMASSYYVAFAIALAAGVCYLIYAISFKQIADKN